jgi:hypothetical protein
MGNRASIEGSSFAICCLDGMAIQIVIDTLGEQLSRQNIMVSFGPASQALSDYVHKLWFQGIKKFGRLSLVYLTTNIRPPFFKIPFTLFQERRFVSHDVAQ